jgi:hypothetical protein
MSAADKELVIREIIVAAGPNPSPKGLKKVFDLMALSSDDRSRVMVLHQIALSYFHQKSKDLIILSEIGFKMKAFYLLISGMVLSGLLGSLTQILVLYPMILFFAGFVGLMIVKPDFRPIFVKAIWNKTVADIAMKDELEAHETRAAI